jgi:ubiquinone/menaquinone biosynthesis C-methylase UbiE/uncharacterized protein YbaR (Trm112 family)
MKQETLDFICCPICKGKLSLSTRKRSVAEIQSGGMQCDSCSEEFPIVFDRPVLMVNNTIHNWLSPIDEALNPSEIRRPEGPLSILRLRQLGVEKAIGIASSQTKKPAKNAFSISEDLKQLKGKIKYIKSGKWLEARGRKYSWLDSLANPSESVSSFLKLVESHNPDSLLDIASGGGSGVASLANVLSDEVKVFSTERDLKCLWIIQEKFKRIKKQTNSEAIGADVRQLPIKNDSICIVTSMMAMQELLGISSVLQEIHRVLQPGGSYIALFNKEPWVYDMIPIEQYKSFAKLVDMYSGYEDLVSKAQKHHLVPVHVGQFTDNSKEFCLVEFEKEKK